MDASVPEPIAQGLNPEQFAAVTTGADQHHLVLAGAGCGKTTVLTRRIAYLRFTGVPLPAILALTFTRKAADEMAQRTASLCKTTSLPLITTFHGFGLHVLSAEIAGQTNFSRLGFSGTVRGCEGDERLRLLAESSTTEERQFLGCSLSQLDALLERLTVFPETASSLADNKKTLLAEIAARFITKKKSLGVWDFSDLIDGVVHLFTEHQNVLAAYSKRFSHILVDEFQDTNPVQITLLRQLLGADRKLFAVGDDDQAIYAFRGADIRPTLMFSTYFPGAEILKLQTNYRSTQAILGKANKIFSDKELSYRKVLVSGLANASAGSRPAVKRFVHQDLGAAWIVATATSLSQKKNIPLHAMAILFRTNQSQGWMQTFLTSRGLSTSDMPHLLTVHKSKGLEFPVVFLCDMEESLFPSYRIDRKKTFRSISELIRSLLAKKRPVDELDVSEERRLFYVAVTRAQKYLYLVHVHKRQVYGRQQTFEPSRFLAYMR